MLETIDEMKQHFFERTKNHIQLVKEYANYLAKEFPIDFASLNAEGHDDSKYEEPEYTPYLLINWKHKIENEGDEFNLTEEEQQRCSEATFHHIKSNAHHPEFWDDNITIKDLTDSRDLSKTCDAIDMPINYIGEMLADWLAMAEELGTSALEWAKKNVGEGKRWKFSSMTERLIFEVLEVIENED